MPGLKADPLRELLALQKQIARRMEERLGAGSRVPEIDSVPETRAGAWSPVMDLYELADSFVLYAELPGIEDSDVTLTIEGRVLTVRGNRRGPGSSDLARRGPGLSPGKKLPGKSKRSSRVAEGVPATAQEFHRMEREYGSFQRSFTLPGAVDPTRIASRWKDGVLEVKLLKKKRR